MTSIVANLSKLVTKTLKVVKGEQKQRSSDGGYGDEVNQLNKPQVDATRQGGPKLSNVSRERHTRIVITV